MSNVKRASLICVVNNSDKVKSLKRKGSLRISIPLEEPTSKVYSRFNYETLHKSALNKKRLKREKSVQNGTALGLSNGFMDVDEDDEEEDVRKIAKKFELKYGGTLKKDKYSELGAGYDNDDPFIDDTDAFNDELSEDLLPKHGGYYLNQGNLELERIELPEEVIENEEEISARKIKRTINVIQSSDEESSEAEESGADNNEEDGTEEDDEEEEEEEDEGDADQKIEKDQKQMIENRKGEDEGKENNISNSEGQSKIIIQNSKETKVVHNSKGENYDDILLNHSISSTIESVVTNSHSSRHKHKIEKDNNVVKKKRKREHNEQSEREYHKHKKHQKKLIESEESPPSKDHHKHPKKHKDRTSEDRDRKDKKKCTTVKDLLSEKKVNTSELNLSATPLNITSNQVSLPSSEDVDIILDGPSELPHVNGHVKDEPCPSVSDLKLPENLPEDIRDIVNRLKIAASQVSNLSSRKIFPADVNKLLIELEARCRTISSTAKHIVFSYLGTFLPLSKDTLIKRAKKMSVDKEEERLENLITKLKIKIDALMPEVEIQYSKDCKLATQAAAEKNNEDQSGDQKPSEKIIMPKKIFPWDEQLRCYMRDIIDIKIRCYRIMNPRNITEEQYIKEYLNTKVKSLWPDGWMRWTVLLKEGKSQESDKIRKYTPKPASKKIVPPPLQHHQQQPTPPPAHQNQIDPSQQQLQKMEKQLQQQKLQQNNKQTKVSMPTQTSFSAESLLSTISSSNPLSYQTAQSPSLFSQIQNSMSKIPLGSSTSASSISNPSIPQSISVANVSGGGTISVKKTPTPPKTTIPSSHITSPHSILNLINTTKAHVSNSKYNYSLEQQQFSGLSSNSFTQKSSDVLPPATSVSSHIHPSTQSYLPPHSYEITTSPNATLASLSNMSKNLPLFSQSGLSSFRPKSPTLANTSLSTSSTYKLPPFSQPLPYSTALSSLSSSSNTSFPIPSSPNFIHPPSPSSSPTLSRKSVSPLSSISPPKKRISSSPTSPFVDTPTPSNILDLSPKGHISPSVSYAKQPDSSTSSVTSKVNMSSSMGFKNFAHHSPSEHLSPALTTKAGVSGPGSMNIKSFAHQLTDTSSSPISSKISGNCSTSLKSYGHHQQQPDQTTTSPVSSKVGGSGPMSLKQRILQENAKTPSFHSEEPSGRLSSHSNFHQSDFHRLQDESGTAASALSQMINDSLLGTPPMTLSSVGSSLSMCGNGALSLAPSAFSRPDNISKSTLQPNLSIPLPTNMSKLSKTSVIDTRSDGLSKLFQSMEPRERKSSRSSSKESDGKESELVDDVLKSLMSLNQMSTNNSPEKAKGFLDTSSNASNSFTSDIMNKSNESQGVPKMRGFEDEFRKHLKMNVVPGSTSTPDVQKDMKMKTFQTDQMMLNNTASEFALNLPPSSHLAQGNCVMEGFIPHSVIMPQNRSTCTTFKPRCHYSDL